jgi:hypothetical protein
MKDRIIKTITIEIAGVEVEVTPQQAKDLHRALSELLGLDKPQQIIEKEVIRDHYHNPYWPYITKTWPSSGTAGNPNIDRFRVTYSSENANARLAIS